MAREIKVQNERTGSHWDNDFSIKCSIVSIWPIFSKYMAAYFLLFKIIIIIIIF